jgi:hypothetical protein
LKGVTIKKRLEVLSTSSLYNLTLFLIYFYQSFDVFVFVEDFGSIEVFEDTAGGKVLQISETTVSILCNSRGVKALSPGFAAGASCAFGALGCS